MIEQIPELDLNEEYDCNSFGLAFDAYRPKNHKQRGAECRTKNPDNLL